MFCFTPRPIYLRGRTLRCPLNRRLSVHQSRSESFEKDKKSLTPVGNKPWFFGHWDRSNEYVIQAPPSRMLALTTLTFQQRYSLLHRNVREPSFSLSATFSYLIANLTPMSGPFCLLHLCDCTLLTAYYKAVRKLLKLCRVRLTVHKPRSMKSLNGFSMAYARTVFFKLFFNHWPAWIDGSQNMLNRKID